ncbi:MAG TPA: UbiA family prenyltransferase [Methanobacterium sp.]|nr:UbiA family prenyltransferase [Methanobacterium sp.]
MLRIIEEEIITNINVNTKNIELELVNSLKNEIFYGGYFAALCSPAFILFTANVMDIKVGMPILLIAYLLPLIVYSYDYYSDIEKDINEHSERAVFLEKKANKYPLVLGFYTISLAALLILFFNFNLVLFILGLITVGILYNVALKDLTKKIPIFKNVYTALTWALGGAFFPVLYYSTGVNSSVLIAFMVIFLRCLNNILFFDLKDIENDKKEKLKTLPVILGKKNTINVLHGLNIISFIPLIIGIYMKAIPLFVLSLTFFGVYSFYYIKKAEKTSGKELETVSHTLADMEFVLWPIILVVAKFLI